MTSYEKEKTRLILLPHLGAVASRAVAMINQGDLEMIPGDVVGAKIDGLIATYSITGDDQVFLENLRDRIVA
jgi:hypothetical protein